MSYKVTKLEDHKNIPIDKWPVAVQAIVKGISIICKISDDGPEMQGEKRPIADGKLKSSPELKKELTDFFKIMGEDFSLKGYLFDGHFYISDLDPNKFSFQDRYTFLVEAYTEYLKTREEGKYFHILTVTLAYSPEQINDFLKQYQELGYEGEMEKKLEPTKFKLKLKVKEETTPPPSPEPKSPGPATTERHTIYEKFNKMPQPEFLVELRKFAEAYEMGQPLIDDQTFDRIMVIYERRFKTEFGEIGAVPKGTKVELPYYMGSIRKIKRYYSKGF